MHDEHELEAKLQKEANEIWDEHKAKEMGGKLRLGFFPRSFQLF